MCIKLAVTEDYQPDIKTLLKSLIRPVEGEIGLEIEVEGNQFPKPSSYGSMPVKMGAKLPYWSCVKDGSLRGDDNAEYLLSKPIMFTEVQSAVEQLQEALADYGSVLAESNRTSVHVHLNAQGFHLNRLASFCALYFCFEEVLTEWCGDHRVGNLFCMRAKDAPAIVTRVIGFIKNNGYFELSQSLHYSALNIHALTKLGSLEVRTLRGVTDFDLILQWVSILQRLYELSSEYKDPRDIISLFSQHGPLGFFDTILGPLGIVVRQGIEMSDNDIRASMYEGIRIAQDVAYCRDWSTFKELRPREDPFGRSPEAVATQFMTSVLSPYPAPSSQLIGTYLSDQPTEEYEGEYDDDDDDLADL